MTMQPDPTSRKPRLRRLSTWLIIGAVGWVLVAASAGDEAPTQQADEPSTRPAQQADEPSTRPAQQADEPSTRPAQQSDESDDDDEPAYSAADTDVCERLLDEIITPDGGVEDPLEFAQTLRALSRLADDTMLSYHIEGMANDVDSMISEGQTSSSLDAYQSNLSSGAALCGDALGV